MHVKRGSAVLLAAAMLVSAALSPMRASGDDSFVRSTDGQVKNIIKAIADSDRRFEKALDSKFKNSVARGPSGEVDVKKYLGDLKQDINEVAQRFTDKYAASAEVGNLLARASLMHAYMRQNPQTKGASEWDQLAGYLGDLAGAYGSTFPLAQGAAVRRVGDREVLHVADELSKQPDRVESALHKAARSDKSLASVDAAAAKDLDALADALKAFKSRLKSEKAASAEARQVIVVGDRLDALVRDTAVPDSVRAAWSPANQQLEIIAQAFAIPRPGQPVERPAAPREEQPEQAPAAAAAP